MQLRTQLSFVSLGSAHDRTGNLHCGPTAGSASSGTACSITGSSTWAPFGGGWSKSSFAQRALTRLRSGRRLCGKQHSAPLRPELQGYCDCLVQQGFVWRHAVLTRSWDFSQTWKAAHRRAK